MRKAEVLMHGIPAGVLIEVEPGKRYRFEYRSDYAGNPVSLGMPIERRTYEFDDFPPFFEGLLPEGLMLEGLLRLRKIDRRDYFSQLVAVGRDLVGAVTVQEAE